MAFLQIPQNFKFKPIFPILSHFQDEGNPSSTQHTPISFKDMSSIILLFDIACEKLSKQIPQKKCTLYEVLKSFRIINHPIDMAKIHH